MEALDAYEQIGAWAPPAGYDGTARYRDFRTVLIDGGASAEQCRRVCNMIFAHCGLLNDPTAIEPVGGDDTAAAGFAVETHLTFARIGKQNVGRWLLSQITTIPKSEPLPERAISEEPD